MPAKVAGGLPGAPGPPSTLLGQVHNADIAAGLNEIAEMLEIGDANPFRIRAYRTAARVIGGLSREVSAMIERGDNLDDLPGIGEDLAQKISDLARTGTTPMLENLRRGAPRGLAELLRLPGLGPKRIRLLHDEFGVETLPQLHRALKDGRLDHVRSLGAKTAARLLHAIETRSKDTQRFKRAVAAQYAEPLLAYLRDRPGVEKAMIAGSYRRARDTVGDIDIIAAAEDGAAVIRDFVRYPEVAEVVAQGPARSTVFLRSRLQIDLRVVPPVCYGAALVYFTGSKAHNIAIRRLAQEQGLKISEYGVFRGDTRIAGTTEDEVYRTIGLPLIPPELREDQGELVAASAGRLPHLVALEDMKGDLHVHTTATDGRNSLEEMVAAAKARGYDYIAITEHSRRLSIAHGLDEARLAEQIKRIDALNDKRPGITVLKGIEVDILEDGGLDLPDGILGRLDLAVAAIHSKFDLSKTAQTERILRALDNPNITIVAHPTGRLIGEREPYDIDMEKILRKARARGCFVELNAHPDRLDLLDTHCRMARDLGVLVCVSTDAHATGDLANMQFGVGQARRGWLEAGDVLNTRPLGALRKLLARSRGH